MNAQLLTGIFTLAAASVGFWGIRYTQRQQAQQQELQRQRDREKDHLADARTLCDAKRERLRALYADMLDTAYTLSALGGGVARELPFDMPDKYNRHMTAIREQATPLLEAIRRTLALLALEADAREFHNTFQLAAEFHWMYGVMQAQNQRQSGAYPPEHIEMQRKRFEASTLRLEELARDHLAELDTPLPAPELAPTPLATAPRSWGRLKFWRL